MITENPAERRAFAACDDHLLQGMEYCSRNRESSVRVFPVKDAQDYTYRCIAGHAKAKWYIREIVKKSEDK